MSSIIKTVKVFRNGGSQAIRLPKEFAIEAKEVVLRKDFGVIGAFAAGLREYCPAHRPLEARAARRIRYNAVGASHHDREGGPPRMPEVWMRFW